MTTLGNKEIMSRNIQKYMKLHDLSRTDLCDALGVKYTTLTDWINGKTYPRIDKIEKMANYFNIRKSDLVESSPAITPVPVSLSSDIHKKIFSKNLLFYLQQNQKKQREVALAVGVSPQTFNTWCQAIALPRMGKLQRIADYFKIEKSDLIDAHSPDTIQPVSLSLAENAVVAGYRAADQPTKTVVKRLLNVE